MLCCDIVTIDRIWILADTFLFSKEVEIDSHSIYSQNTLSSNSVTLGSVKKIVFQMGALGNIAKGTTDPGVDCFDQ